MVLDFPLFSFSHYSQELVNTVVAQLLPFLFSDRWIRDNEPGGFPLPFPFPGSKTFPSLFFFNLLMKRR